MIQDQKRIQAFASTPHQYNTHTYGQFGFPTMLHFLDEPEKENHRSRTVSSCRGAQLEDETNGSFCWRRPIFRCHDLEEEVEHEGV